MLDRDRISIAAMVGPKTKISKYIAVHTAEANWKWHLQVLWLSRRSPCFFSLTLSHSLSLSTSLSLHLSMIKDTLFIFLECTCAVMVESMAGCVCGYIQRPKAHNDLTKIRIHRNMEQVLQCRAGWKGAEGPRCNQTQLTCSSSASICSWRSVVIFFSS